MCYQLEGLAANIWLHSDGCICRHFSNDFRVDFKCHEVFVLKKLSMSIFYCHISIIKWFQIYIEWTFILQICTSPIRQSAQAKELLQEKTYAYKVIVFLSLRLRTKEWLHLNLVNEDDIQHDPRSTRERSSSGWVVFSLVEPGDLESSSSFPVSTSTRRLTWGHQLMRFHPRR